MDFFVEFRELSLGTAGTSCSAAKKQMQALPLGTATKA